VRATGLEVVGIPVDDVGIRVDMLDRANVDVVVVTSAHQYPTGAVLPPDRRASLVDWATRRDTLVVEDDYDAEFRYDREPIGSIQGLCPDRVVYAGSASKILAPGLRLGWLVVPARFVEAIGQAKLVADQGSAAIDQLAFADFIAGGELDRHLRRVRPIYRRRRDALLTALGLYLPRLEPVGASAGLHLMAWLPEDLAEGEFVRAAAERGIGVYGLAPCRIARGGRGAIVFGYATPGEAAITSGVKQLGAAVAGRRT
jgi:GntR family transcriptional regulator/MocR family aminotransferase